MVAALAIVGVSMLSPTKVQAVSLRLGDFTLDASNGASIRGPNGLSLDASNGASIRGLDGLSLDTNDQPSAPEK
jgi:hypothetical protein